MSEDPSVDATTRILRERAARYAIPKSSADLRQHIDCVVFELAAAQFAVNVANVDNVLGPSVIMPVPGTPVFVRGITNCRGIALTVIDMRGTAGTSAGDEFDPASVVVVRVDDIRFGLLADSILRIERVFDGELVFARPRGGEARQIPLLGATAGGVSVIDVQRLVQDARYVVEDTVDMPGRNKGGIR